MVLGNWTGCETEFSGVHVHGTINGKHLQLNCLAHNIAMRFAELKYYAGFTILPQRFSEFLPGVLHFAADWPDY